MERRTELIRLSLDEITRAVRSVLPEFEVVSAMLANEGRANTNYFVEGSGGRLVLRIYVRDAGLCAKESALLRLLSPFAPLAQILGSKPASAGLGHPFSLFEFVTGESLQQIAIAADQQRQLAAARALGEFVARLTEVHFEHVGDLRAGKDGTLELQAWTFSDFYQWCLFESPAGERLGPLRDRLWHFLRDQGERFSDAPSTHLVHGDLNPTNLLIRQDGQLAAVIDWEFAHAGCLWSDLGNLLRRRPEFRFASGFEAALMEGLSSGGVGLPSNWPEFAAFHDLSSACEFLSSAEEHPERHRSARRQIEETLAMLGG